MMSKERLPLDQDFVSERDLRKDTHGEISRILGVLRSGDQASASQQLAELKRYLETARTDSLKQAGSAEGIEKDNLLTRTAELDHVLDEIAPLEREIAGT